MKKILLALGILTASFAQAETIDVSTLSEAEKIAHRIGFCDALWDETVGKSYYCVGSCSYDDEKSKRAIAREKVLYKISQLMAVMPKSLFTHYEVVEVYWKSWQDVKAEAILEGELFARKVPTKMLISCEEDLMKMFKENYVPHFKYMSE